MPELLTKYPGTVLKILKDANIKCGTGASQNILVSCPKDDFCSLPTGELCIYGTNNISQMTQIHSADFLVTPNAIIPFAALLVMIFLLGVWLGTHVNPISK